MTSTENERITIGFKFIDTLGNEYSSSSSIELMEDYLSELDTIGVQFNAFLKQCGYYRRGDYMLMESLTDDEIDALERYLAEIRNDKEGESCNESNT